MERTRRASQVFAERMKAARESAGLTQEQLSKRLDELAGDWEDGVRLKRPAIAEIERGARRVTLDEWLAIAAALGVAPLHLVVPFEDPEPVVVPRGQMVGFNAALKVRVSEEFALLPAEARDWIKGVHIYVGADMRQWFRYYVEEVPPPQRWNIERDLEIEEGREPRPPAAPEGRQPRIGDQFIRPVRASVYELLRQERKEKER